MSDVIDRLRAIYPEHHQVNQWCVRYEAATEIERLRAENEKLRAALERALIGGNHLATLIGVDHPLDTATHYEAAAHYAHTNNINGYEAWCCWKALRAAAAAAYLGEKDD